MTHIIVDRPAPGVMTLTLNRPEHNAFNFAMYAALLDLLHALRTDLYTRVVIVTGSGRFFSVGHDLRNAGTQPWFPAEIGEGYIQQQTALQISSIPHLMRGLPQVFVGAVNGPAVGIAYALLLACDMCIAGRSAKFINAVHNTGIGTELGMSYFLPRAVGSQRAAELLLTSRAVEAEEAARIGLALSTVDDDQLQAACMALAERILVNTPMDTWLTKQAHWLSLGAGGLEAAVELENRSMTGARATEDAVEKRKAFFEKRAPRFLFR